MEKLPQMLSPMRRLDSVMWHWGREWLEVIAKRI
jgi:hypothetical protein